MTPVAAGTLAEARNGGFVLTVEDDVLRCRPALVPPDLLEKLRANKNELREMLTGTRCRRCGDRLNYRRDWNTRAFADGTGTCGPCYYLEAAERACCSPDALADPAELTVRGEELP
jgi:hypothetical protein